MTPFANKVIAERGVEGLLTGNPSLNWRAAYTTVAGELPLSEWPRRGWRLAVFPIGVARSQLEVSNAGQGQADV